MAHSVPASAVAALALVLGLPVAMASQGWWWTARNHRESLSHAAARPAQSDVVHHMVDEETQAELVEAAARRDPSRHLPFHGLVSFLEESGSIESRRGRGTIFTTTHGGSQTHVAAPAPAAPAQSSLSTEQTTTAKILDTTAYVSTATTTTTPPPPYVEPSTTATEPPPVVQPLNNSTTPDVAEFQARAEAAHDCVVSEWNDWSGCATISRNELRSAVQTRNRDITNEPSGNGAVCPALSEQRSCENEDTGITDFLKSLLR